ncbi:C40 family peptidase [Candidatus Riflebacteria bacterium]
MRSLFLLLLFLTFIAGCGSKNNGSLLPLENPEIEVKMETEVPEKTLKEKGALEILQQNVPQISKQYMGIGYKYGSNPDTSSLSDCSNLICAITRNSVKNSGYLFLPYYFPTAEIYNNSEALNRSELKIGDIVFFTWDGGKQKHAGIVIESTATEVIFIHASSSKGVIKTSTLDSAWKYYWQERFNSFRRWNETVFSRTENQ